MKNFHDFLSSKKVRLTAGVVGAFFLAALIFHAGVVVGSHRGTFGRFGMERGFRSSFFPGGFELPHGFMFGTHGAVGTITAVTLPTLTLQTREGTNETILVDTSTIIRNMGAADTKALATGTQAIVLGEPDSQGRIDAKLIRILPSAPSTP